MMVFMTKVWGFGSPIGRCSSAVEPDGRTPSAP